MANKDLYRYALRMGDSAIVLSHRACEMIGTAPILEEDIALSNIGLDTIGQGTVWLEHAAKWQGEGKTADDLAYWRTEREYTNYLITELENGDFGRVILRNYFYSRFLALLYADMTTSNVPEFVAIAQKSSKEVTYHLQHSRDWLMRLGLGTEESHRRMTDALDFLWPYTKELFDQDALELTLTESGAVPDRATLYTKWLDLVTADLRAATLTPPDSPYFYDGGTHGVHTEALGYVLAEMQSTTREHPDGVW